ncbi:hypothetical protein [Holospora curviuscula]|uniref:Uncharacterized protein n=1 Tax=Holospora curviuscula TaxID=1082868 RepID=A0A2S5R8R6_9PROT|nr:hypothetical protein [Holospora curviuscula]PPE03525.1 hypothetical protein HCUR_01069 [Holospora curviuscula]
MKKFNPICILPSFLMLFSVEGVSGKDRKATIRAEKAAIKDEKKTISLSKCIYKQRNYVKRSFMRQNHSISSLGLEDLLNDFQKVTISKKIRKNRKVTIETDAKREKISDKFSETIIEGFNKYPFIEIMIGTDSIEELSDYYGEKYANSVKITEFDDIMDKMDKTLEEVKHFEDFNPSNLTILSKTIINYFIPAVQQSILTHKKDSSKVVEDLSKKVVEDLSKKVVEDMKKTFFFNKEGKSMRIVSTQKGNSMPIVSTQKPQIIFLKKKDNPSQ